jgi:hypothetical protein
MNSDHLIQQATMAPSGHNTQPWKFKVQKNIIRIYPDFSRRLPVVDPDDHALYISLGCALENLVIAAQKDGYTSKVNYFPNSEDYLEVEFSEGPSAEVTGLYRAIPERQSNRRIYNGSLISDDHLQQLSNANIYPDVELKIIQTDDKQIEPVIEFVKEANHIQFNDSAFIEELVSWIRFSKHEALERKDGLTSSAMGFPSVPRWLGNIIIRKFAKPEGEARKCEKMIRSSAVLIFFIAKNQTKKNWVDVGRSFERAALTATSLGISHAHLNMPCEVEAVRKKLSDYFELDTAEEPMLLIRFGYAKSMPRSPRRDISEIVISKN